MNDWQRQTAHPDICNIAPARPDPEHVPAGIGRTPGHARVTLAGADWLASASAFPRSVHALWQLRPSAPSVLPCGRAFDVVSTPPLFGRQLLDKLWSAGPGSGPAAVHRGRTMLFAAPGTADRLPKLLDWEEWHGPTGPDRTTGQQSALSCGADPGLLCHGSGDAVTVPALHPAGPEPAGSRWLVAPDVRHPWLPGPDVLLWACIRAQRAAPADSPGGQRRQSIFTRPERDATVYDVNGRR